MQREFTKINGELCLSVDALARTMGMEYDLALNTVKKGLARFRKGTSKYWRHYKDALDSRLNWVAYEGLPTDTKLRVEYLYSDVSLRYYTEELISQARTLIEPGDVSWFEQAYPYSAAQAKDLSEACGWCRLLSNDVQMIFEGYFKNKKTLFDISAKVVGAQKLYGFKIGNARVLQRKVKAFRESGRDSLLSKKLGNVNATKGANCRELIEKRIVHLYASALNPDMEIISRIFNNEAVEKSWANMSVATIRRIVRKPQYAAMIAAMRDGVNSARGGHEWHMKRARPSRPDMMWSFDGTTVQLYNADNKGKAIKSWYILYVTDAATNCVVGWALGRRENSQLILRALRKAFTFGMYVPKFFQYDNFSANKGKEVQDVIGKLESIGIPGQPYNGKGKYVERIIGQIEQRVMRHLPNFVGGNITGRSKKAQRNPDYIKWQEKNGRLPSEADIIEQVDLAIKVWNHTANKKGVRPIDAYNVAHPERKRMTAITLANLFWVKRSKMLRYNPEGFRMEVAGELYYYEVYSEDGVTDVNFRKYHGGERFIVRYDPDDLSRINVYNQNDSWVATAEKKYEYAAVPSERQEGEGERLLKELDNRKNYIDDAVKEYNVIDQEMAAIGLSRVGFDSIHKDSLNEIEGKQELVLLNRTGIVKKNTRVFDDDEAANRLLNNNESD